jgi:oligopeptide transport system permease protein
MTDHAPPLAVNARPRSEFARRMARFRRNKAALAGAVLMALIVTVCLLGPLLSPYGLDDQDYDAINLVPSLASAHPLGTDDLGRDLLTRVLIGGRSSLLIGFAATAISLVIGTLYGATAGFLGGRIDAIMMRAVDVLYALPFLFLVIMLTMVFGRSLTTVLLAIGSVQWLTPAVMVRGHTLSLKAREFIEAAHAGGMTPLAIVIRHIIPNTLGTVIVYAGMSVPQAILGESFLSFLGLGVEPTEGTTWGVLLDAGAAQMEATPWLLLVPGLFVTATLFSLNFIADGLRDAFDPKEN